MTKLSTTATFTALSLLAAPLAAQAPAMDKGIVVTPSSEIEIWVQKVSADLNGKLKRQIASPRETRSGVVQVSFQCDERGNPSNIAVFSNTGGNALKTHGINAVQRLESLHPLPDGTKVGQKFLANIIYADSAEEAERLHTRLMGMERRRLASSGEERTFLALK